MVMEKTHRSLGRFSLNILMGTLIILVFISFIGVIEGLVYLLQDLRRSPMVDFYLPLYGLLIYVRWAVFVGFLLSILVETSLYVTRKAVRRYNLVAIYISSVFSMYAFIFLGLKVHQDWFSGEFVLVDVSRILATLVVMAVCTGIFCGLYYFIKRVLQKSLIPYLIRRTSFKVIIFSICLFAVLWTGFRWFYPKIMSTESSLKRAVFLDEKQLKNCPNIILIVMDTCRADHLSSYGYFRETTPHIDRIAREGRLYENAFTVAPWTLPSHASIFTGMYLSRHGTHGEHTHLEDQYFTLAEVLKEIGYQTVGFSTAPWVSKSAGLAQGFDRFEEMWRYDSINRQKNRFLANRILSKIKNLYNDDEYQKGISYKPYNEGTEKTNELILNWLRKNRANKKEMAPFFMFINYFQAHAPYLPPPPYHTMHIDPRYDMEEIIKVEQEKYKYLTGMVKWDERRISALNSLYDGDITYLDIKMNEIFEWLRSHHILDNTFLIITSDHGENIGEHNFKGHQFNVYNTLLHIPLILRYPKLFSQEERRKEVVQTIDIFPSIMDLIGIKWRDSMLELQGRSLLENKVNNNAHAFALAEYFLPINELQLVKTYYPDYDISHLERRLIASRVDTFKFIWTSDNKDELYNLYLDPDETKNIIDEMPEKAITLRKVLFTVSEMSKSENEKLDTKENELSLDAQTEEKLRSLGYLK